LARIDPAVSRAKFEREITRLAEQRDQLQARGIFVFGLPTYPIVEFLYVPLRPLKVAIPNAQPTTIVLPPGASAMAVAEIPNLAARAFKARFDLTDYDIRAPSLEFRDPQTDNPLVYGTMLRAIEYEKGRQAHNVLLDDHPTTHKPFLCLRGFREYHEHPQHSGDDWLLYRSDLGLFSSVMSLWRVTIDLVEPIMMLQPGGIQVNWNAIIKD
jgi:hypothetical protein